MEHQPPSPGEARLNTYTIEILPNGTVAIIHRAEYYLAGKEGESAKLLSTEEQSITFPSLEDARRALETALGKVMNALAVEAGKDRREGGSK